ncbi:hypothetical protein GQ44DRAFT_755574 [Phaeosphaeriaceae sp. PMI808]|nr:hypothetical protein GQ44DRAFT_755574 [Phaeosphaeriaceae sp. PMI808]
MTLSTSLKSPNRINLLAQKRLNTISKHLSRSNMGTHSGRIQQDMTNNTAPPSAAPTDSNGVKAQEKECWVCPGCKRPTNIEKPQTGPNGEEGPVPDTNNQLIPPPEESLKQHPHFIHCKAITTPKWENKFSIFTAGSIEMGKAVQWQPRLAEHLRDLPITVYNPRRGGWDPKVDVKAKNESFRQQVVWELDALHKADVICFFFDQDTLSGVTLLELGLWAHSGKIIVCCPELYWRSGNVKIACDRYKIPRVPDFASLVEGVRTMLALKGLGHDDAGRKSSQSVSQDPRWWTKLTNDPTEFAKLRAIDQQEADWVAQLKKEEQDRISELRKLKSELQERMDKAEKELTTLIPIMPEPILSKQE